MAIKRLCDICGKECTMDEHLSLHFGPQRSTSSLLTDGEAKTVFLADICIDCYNWLAKELNCRKELYENVE